VVPSAFACWLEIEKSTCMEGTILASNCNSQCQCLTAILNDRHVDQLVRVCHYQMPIRDALLCLYAC
jgi:hypothetical protein